MANNPYIQPIIHICKTPWRSPWQTNEMRRRITQVLQLQFAECCSFSGKNFPFLSISELIWPTSRLKSSKCPKSSRVNGLKRRNNIFIKAPLETSYNSNKQISPCKLQLLQFYTVHISGKTEAFNLICDLTGIRFFVYLERKPTALNF